MDPKDPKDCVRCKGQDEYEEVCQECLGDGCDFCNYVGSIWVPC